MEINNSNIKVGMYIRLSESDPDKEYYDESESVQNQRILLTDYVEKNNMQLIKEYVDDGYSGQTFDRPGFIEMMKDVKDKVIDTIVVKDLSRFGRDHVMTGFYIENYFPDKKVRFISVGEGLDSFNMQNSNDSFTFIIACNDYYSRHYSMKIRDILKQKQKEGKYVGGNPPYGYMRDPKDKGHLIPNPETAPIVRKIFEMLTNDISNEEIIKYLNNNGFFSPNRYKDENSKTIWTSSSLKSIINNPLYTGDMVQHRGEKLSYKSDKHIVIPKKDWIVVEGTHEALVSKEDLHYIKRIGSHCRTRKNYYLLDRLLYCDECSHQIDIRYMRNTNFGFCYQNGKYNSGFMYDKLEKYILRLLYRRNFISSNKPTRKELFRIIDKIFINHNRKITIVLNDTDLKPINLQYTRKKIIIIKNK